MYHERSQQHYWFEGYNCIDIYPHLTYPDKYIDVRKPLGEKPGISSPHHLQYLDFHLSPTKKNIAAILGDFGLMDWYTRNWIGVYMALTWNISQSKKTSFQCSQVCLCSVMIKLLQMKHEQSHYPLVNIQKAMERSTIFNGYIHYFYGHFLCHYVTN